MRRVDAYSPTAKLLHWVMAPIVITLIPVGLVMADLKPGALQDWLFVFHESLGVTVLALILLRIGNRLRGAPPPAPILSPLERAVSVSVHRALYALLLVTPILGWFALSAYGLGPSFFWLGHLPQLIGKDEPLSKILFAVHEAAGLTIAALVVLHFSGALRHALRRDGVTARMLPSFRRR
jgi:cytochrome b561